MRLIDADELWMEVIHTMDYCDDILEIIEHQKTIEPTHLNDSNTLKALDCIGRQEAIDAMYALVDGCERNDPYKENPHIDAIVDTLENLPSAQPEVIRCNDCKHWTQSMGKMKGYGLGRCDFHDADLVTCNGFCYWAERKDDG